MMTDLECHLSDDQDISQVVASYRSTNAYDFGANSSPAIMAYGEAASPLASPNDPGRSRDLQLDITLTETVTSAGAATIDFQLLGHTSDSATYGDWTVVQTTGAIALATLVAGYKPRLSIPAGFLFRFLAVGYVIAGATTTAGLVDADLVFDRQLEG